MLEWSHVENKSGDSLKEVKGKKGKSENLR